MTRSLFPPIFPPALFSALAVLAAAHAARAQVELPPTVVTATRLETPITELSNSVTVITAEEIERRQARTVSDVLADVPGLRLAQLGPIGQQTSVFTRGANSNQTLVLIDGQEAMDPSTANGAFDFAHLTVANVERIEVVRGPASTLYGSNAIGGVINIITKQGAGAPRGNARLEGGNHGTFNQGGGFSGALGKFNASGSVMHLNTDGQDITPKRLRQGSPAILAQPLPAETDGYENLTTALKLGVDPVENVALSLTGRFTRAHSDLDLATSLLDFSSQVFEDPNAQSSADQYFTRAEAKGTFFDAFWQPKLGFAYSRQERSLDNPPDSISQTRQSTFDRGTREKVDLQNDFHLFEGNVLTLGGERQRETMHETSFFDSPSAFGPFVQQGTTNAHAITKAAYLQDQFRLFERFTGTVGGRLDDHSRFGEHPTGRMTGTYRHPETATKLSAAYGTGFRAPALFELFGQTASNFGVFNGNPNLKPETSKSWEAGFEQDFLGNRLAIGSTYFHNDIANLIVCNVNTCNNVFNAETWGAESFLRFDVTKALRAQTSYTYTRAVDASKNEDLLRRPKHKADARLTWFPFAGAELTAGALYIGKQRDVTVDGGNHYPGGYTLVNMAGAYRPVEHVKLYMRVDNLFDRRYEVADGFRGPGITGLAGIAAEF